MNSIQRVSTLPVRCMTASVRRSRPIVETTPSRSLGIAHVAPARNLDPFFGDQRSFEMEQVVQLSTPTEIKDAMGIDKVFVEKKGSEVIAYAATKKLLAEEKLRQGLKTFSVPLEGIVFESNKAPKSGLRSTSIFEE